MTKLAALLVSFIIFSQAHADVCWKDSVGRGIGAVPDQCSVETESKSGLLCYEKCRPGFTIIAGVCWSECPAGWQDDGAFCKKPTSYTRGTLWFSQENCEKAHPKEGCEQSWGAIYPRCKPGYVAHTATECSPECPNDMKDIGISCTKQSYIVKPITPTCSEDQEYNAGLCYNSCPQDFVGVGPVCWGNCPPDKPIDCGALCGESTTDCLKNIGQMVFSLGELAAKVAGMVTTLGASSFTSDAAKAALKSATDSMKETAKKIAKEVKAKIAPSLSSVKSYATEELTQIVSELQSSVVDKLTRITSDQSMSTNEKLEAAQALTTLAGDISANIKTKITTFDPGLKTVENIKAEITTELLKQFPGVSPELTEQLTNMVTNPDSFDYKEFFTKLDPIGISNVVNAFNKKICGKE